MTAGVPYARKYTFTRNDGPGGSITYNVGWIGNDGTFTAAATTVALAKGGSTSLRSTSTRQWVRTRRC